MRRREFITLLGGAAVAWPLAARAQQPERVRRVGVLVGLAENDPEMKERIAGLRQGLEKLGWAEGSNLRIDYRFAPAGAQARLLARELIALQPDVILTSSTPATAAMQQETENDPDRLRWRRRPDRFGLCCELVAARRQSHRPVAIRGGHHRQMAGDAQGNCTEFYARCPCRQSKNGGVRLLPAVGQSGGTIARDRPSGHASR